MWRKTTAYNKILDTFNERKRIYCIQGSQGAGKTYSILMLLCALAHDNRGMKIVVAQQEFSKMKLTIMSDFVKLMKSGRLFNDSEWNKSNHVYTFKSESTITFIGLDKEDIGKGLRCDVFYLNEANKTNFETFRAIASRAKKVVFDYNPNFRFWAHDEIVPREDCKFLKLTFEDNECLSNEERAEILRYKEQGYNEDGTIKNQYWANMWRVYGLGEIGVLVGTIFTNVTTGDFPQELPYVYGMDFGSKDPTTLVKVAVDQHQRKIYVEEKLYSGGLNTYQIAEAIKKNTKQNEKIIGDSAAAQTINDLRSLYKINIQECKKNKVVDDIRLIQSYEIVCTNTSINILDEFSKYVWLEKGNELPIDKFNHCLTSDTLIKTNKGDERIVDLKVGDFVFTSNGYRQITKVFNNGRKKILCFKIKFHNFELEIKSTEEHKVKTNSKWKQIKDLKAGDKVFLCKCSTEKNLKLSQNTQNKNFVRELAVMKEEITSIEVLYDDYQNVYDIEVEEMHEFFANGLLVHNCIDAMRYGFVFLTQQNTGVRRAISI